MKLQGIIFRCPVISQRVKIRPKNFRLWLEPRPDDQSGTPIRDDVRDAVILKGGTRTVLLENISVGVTFNCDCGEIHSVYLYN